MNDPWWRVAWAPTPDEWAALFAGLTLVAAVIAAAIALRQLRAHFEAERARSRPYVLVDYTFKSILMQVEIKNIGATAAANIELRVSPPFESGLNEQAKTLNSVFSEAETISMLAPGRRILYSFDRAPDYHAAKRPQRYTVTATYMELANPSAGVGSRRWWRNSQPYTDTYVLDFRQWSQATTESDYEHKHWNIATRQEKRTERIAKALQTIAGKIHVADAQEHDTVTQSELASNAEFEHPVTAPKRRPGIEPAQLDANSREPRPLETRPARPRMKTFRLPRWYR